MTSETHLTELLLRWEELRLQGKAISPEQLCGDAPELVEALRQRMGMIEALDAVLAVPSDRADSTIAEGSAGAPGAPLPAVPGYEILGELGRGGMGVVYKARNLAIDRVEALKMIRSRVTPTAPTIKRFSLEIRATAQFEHPRIVRIYAAGEHEGQPYFTMEYVRGGSLARQLDRFTNNPRAAAELLAKVARAVHYLHTKSILHRDLKPANILLRDEQDEPLVSDFGLARFFANDFAPPAAADSLDVSLVAAADLTQTGAVVGTVLYMSPEQTGGQTHQITAAGDVWALGVILYEMLTGERPFGGANRAAVWEAIRESTPRPPRMLQPRVAPDLEAICLKCLAKEPQRRYASAEQLAEDLERWLRGEPIRPERLPSRLWRRIRRYPAASTAIALALALITVLAVILLDRRFSTGSDSDGDGKAREIASARTLQALRANLAAGQPVELIPAVGPPGWFRWSVRGIHDSASGAADQPFSVHGDGYTLLELLPANTLSRYRLRLQVHHQSGAQGGQVGVYFAHGEQPTTDGVLVHGFCAVGFNDISAIPGEPLDQGAQVRLNLQLLYPRFAGQPADSARLQGTGIAKSFQPAGATRPERWRSLQVDVSPKEVQVHWDEKPLSPLPRAKLAQLGRLLVAKSPVRPQEDLAFPPQGGLGLYVFGASAWFRSCSIEPPPDS